MWTPSRLVGEALRNGRPAHVVLALVTAGALFIFSFLEASAVSEIEQAHDRWLGQGGMLVSVEGTDTGVSGDDCLAAGQQPFVIHSAGIGDPNAGRAEVFFARSPDVAFGVVVATTGMNTTMGLEPVVGYGIAAGQLVGEELAVAAGADVALLGTSVTTITYSEESRALGYDRNLLRFVPFTGNRFSACWLELDPSSYWVDGPLLAASFSDTVQLRPFIRLDTQDHALSRLEARATRLVWIPSAMLHTLIWVAWWWFRRREISLYRTVQVSRTGVALMGLTESCVVAVSAVAVACAALLVAGLEPLGTRLGLWAATLAGVAGPLLALPFLLLLAGRNIAVSAKDV